jgi:hypothetical protein
MDNPISLKYLFTATFKDGTVIEQTPDDRSVVDEKRSRFYDVLEEAKKQQLVSFTLCGEGHTYTVDLTDGHFEVDGVSFRMIEGELPEYRIVFFRQHTHDFLMGSDGTQTPSTHTVCYRMGWQCTFNEKNYQRVMEID